MQLTHTKVGDFVMSNCTDLHFVYPGITINSEYYPDTYILTSHWLLFVIRGVSGEFLT